MYQIMDSVLELVIGFAYEVFNTDLSERQAILVFVVGILAFTVLFIFLTIMNAGRLRTLKEKVLSNEVQVVTVQNRRGKTKKVIMDKKDLKNPKKSKRVVSNNIYSINKKSVSNVRED